jgi:SAM-dependent methyltransferase
MSTSLHPSIDRVQAEYFESVTYRDPMHPVVSAYADPKIDFIKQHIPLEGKILDVGCGNGIFTLRLAKAGADVIGLDFSQLLLKQNPHDGLTRGDATALPFADGAFDCVFEANVLHHMQDREAVIREMARTSRKHVVLLEPNRYNPLMFALSLAVREEIGVLKSSLSRLREELGRCGLQLRAHVTTGMISQNNTPLALVPWLKRFDREIWWGEYIVLIAEKIPGADGRRASGAAS